MLLGRLMTVCSITTGVCLMICDKIIKQSIENGCQKIKSVDVYTCTIVFYPYTTTELPIQKQLHVLTGNHRDGEVIATFHTI